MLDLIRRLNDCTLTILVVVLGSLITTITWEPRMLVIGAFYRYDDILLQGEDDAGTLVQMLSYVVTIYIAPVPTFCVKLELTPKAKAIHAARQHGIKST